MKHTKRLRLAFATVWTDDRTKTWSGTPYSLLSALQQRSDIDTIDTPVEVNRRLVSAARLAYVRRVKSKWVSQYRIAPVVAWDENRALNKALRGTDAHVALLIADIGLPHIPFISYFDHTYLHLDDNRNSGRYNADRLLVYRKALLHEGIRRQTSHYQKASALVSMSEWDANYLRNSGRVDPDRVFVVPPGRNAVGRRAPFASKTEQRLLFVGSDFNTKAGEQIVRAFKALRNRVDYNPTLVIAGIDRWPMRGDIPEGVEFLGKIPYSRVHKEMQRACGFVMPSIFEAYGIAFLEALGEGIPVIGRRACAMPEFIVHEENGLLIDEEDTGVEVLSEYMHRLITDMELRKRVYAMADHISYQVSWQRAADDLIRIAEWCREHPNTGS